MLKINISDEILSVVPNFKVIQIEADVINSPTSDDLWEKLLCAAANLEHSLQLPDINKRPGIAATRKAYKLLGKDPNRYRPSDEQLCRRIIQGKGLYRLTTIVDIINLISIVSGYSIGGFDKDKIEGISLTLGVGQEGEEYHGIGRGLLNIHGMPVYRDSIGGIGTPTSDEERTKITPDTKHLLMLINIYGEEMNPSEVIDMASDLLIRYASALSIQTAIIGK